MTTLAFAGSTLWDDSGTGWGPVGLTLLGESGVWIEEHLPGDEGGIVVKYLGSDPGQVVVAMNYLCTDTELMALKSTLAGLRASSGSVVKTSGSLGTVSVGNCVLRRAPVFSTPGGGALLPGGGVRRFWSVFLEFRVVAR